MLEKIFSTFHALNLLLQQQYHEKGFKKYLELISCLLVDEQNNELLMKIHEARLTGFASFLEVNVTTYQHHNQTHGFSCGSRHICGPGCSSRFGNHGSYSKNPYHHLK